MSTSDTDPRNGDDDTDTGSEKAGAVRGVSGWLVVAVLLLAGIVAPALLYWAGQTGDLQSFGLGFKNTYLAVPMVPAILLGSVGIWIALKHR